MQVSIENAAFKTCLQYAPCDLVPSEFCLARALGTCDGSEEQMFFWNEANFAFPYSGRWLPALYTDESMAKQIHLGQIRFAPQLEGDIAEKIEVQSNPENMLIVSWNPATLYFFIVAQDAHSLASFQIQWTGSTPDKEYNELNYRWHIGSGASLAEMRVDCPAGEAITSLSTFRMNVSWTCAPVIGLGGCTDIQTEKQQYNANLKLDKFRPALSLV